MPYAIDSRRLASPKKAKALGCQQFHLTACEG
jgi:hypothetical protein